MGGEDETLQLLLSFFSPLPRGDSAIPAFGKEQLGEIIGNQLFGRISVVQAMMLDAVKDAQRQFPSVIYYREQAAQLITVGDKGLNLKNVVKLQSGL